MKVFAHLRPDHEDSQVRQGVYYFIIRIEAKT